MHLPMTYWLLSGSSEYAEAVPGVDGATADCLGVRDDLLAFGYPADQVLAFCGQAMLKGNIVQAVNSLSDRIQPGDTLVVFWIGHGGAILTDPGQKYWQTYDGVFVIEDEQGNGYGLTGIDPRLMESALRRRLPETDVFFLTDTARGGVFKETFSLEGPTADDFKGLSPHTRAASPNAHAGAPGALRQALKGCLRRSLAMADDGQISAMEAVTCLGITSSASVISMIGSGEWTADTTPVIWYPPAPTVASGPALSTSKDRSVEVRPIIRWGGLGIGITGAVAGTVTFIEANNIYATAKEQNFQVPESMRPDIERYDDLKVATYALWGASLLGLATFGGSYLIVVPTPHGLSVSGTF